MKTKRTIIAVLLTIFAVLLTLFIVKSCSTPSSEPVKVILDCDMGYMNDDALALSMLVKAEERGLVDILGITLVGGNNFIDAPYENYGQTQFGSAKYTEDLLTAMGLADIPVFRGTDFPTDLGRNDLETLNAFYKGLEYTKFGDGYGAIHFYTSVDPALLCDSDDAADFLVESVRNNPDEIVIFTVGPTINIAKAINKDADFAPHVKAIYCMGGALGGTCDYETIHSEKVEGIIGANVTSETEYNVICDPVAFERFVTAPFPNRYLLPGSCDVGIDESIAARFISSSDGSGVSGLWAEHYKNYIQEYPYWDPLTVYAFLCPDAVSDSSVEYVTIDADRSSDSFGRTDSITAAEYEALPSEQQASYGKTEVIYQTEGFWDYTIDLLCS